MYQNYQTILRLWPKGTTLLIVSLFTLALLIGSNDAIVKQSSSQSSPSSSVSVSGSSSIPQSQQRSDDSTHQQQQAAATSGAQQAAQAQPYAVSMSVSSSSSSSSSSQSSPSSQAGQASPAQSMQTGSAAMPGMRNSMGSSSNMDYSSGMNQKSYMDSMAAAASNNEQSYQAAANSVNMALANSGIFGAGSPSSSSSSASQQNGQVGYGNSGSNMNQQQQNPAQLNPLHYFYYPSGKDSAQTQQAKPSDMMSGYQPTAASFADQLSGALAASASAPDVAASNQDPTYLPQPSGLDQFGSQQQPQSQQNGASAHNSMQGPHQYNDYANGPQQNGPNQQQMNNQNGPSGGVSFPSSGNGNGPNDYMNLGGSSHQVNQQQQGQQQQPSNSQQSYQNLYNQLNDLSTSNFGNTGALSSPVASYLPSPGSQQQQQQQQVSPQQQSSQMHGQQHNSADLFGSNPFAGSNLAGFNSAASQLSPSAMSPQSAGSPVGQSSGQGSSGLFGSSASLFGGSQQQSQQANSPTNSLFSNQHYLSSFMSPQQAASYASALANAGLPGMGQSADQTVAASQTSPASSASAISGSSGSSNKRFGISSFIMPMLALAGLSLLIPTMSNIGTAVGRKKRSIGEERMSSSNRQQQITHDSMNGSSQVAKENSIGEYMDKIERYYAMYKNAVESDDCMNRLICEFGDTVKDVTGKSAVVTVLERLVPNWMTGKMHLFKEAVMDNRDGKEKCKKYVCNSNKYH